MYMINLSIPTKNKKKETIQQFMPFTWEKKAQADNPKLTKKEIDAMFDKWDKVKFSKKK